MEKLRSALSAFFRNPTWEQWKQFVVIAALFVVLFVDRQPFLTIVAGAIIGAFAVRRVVAFTNKGSSSQPPDPP